MKKRLYKSSTNKMISGVCGGIAEFFNIDPTLVRIIWVALSVFTAFSGVIIYIICAVVIPNAPVTPPGDYYDYNPHQDNRPPK